VSLRALILALSGGSLDFSKELSIDFLPLIEIFVSNPAQLQPAGWGATDHPALQDRNKLEFYKFANARLKEDLK
jgi:hypothetical protein